MADNSKREQIIKTDKVLIETVSGIKSTQRVQPALSELDNFAQTQFPVAAIVGRMPIPEEKRSGREGKIDAVISELKVDIFVYMQVNDDTDTAISDLADDLWKALYTDQNRGGLCLETIIKTSENINVIKPFAAFQITAIHTYRHGTEGI